MAAIPPSSAGCHAPEAIMAYPQDVRQCWRAQVLLWPAGGNAPRPSRSSSRTNRDTV